MNDLNIYNITSAIADPVRLSVMIYLMRGRATYAQLQQHLDVSQSNLSNHLGILYKANLVRKISNGRRNSYEIASADAAQLIELLQNLQKISPNPRNPVKKIALARTCYDHLAGKLGVSIFHSLVDQNAIVYADPIVSPSYFSKEITLGINAEKTFKALGVDLSNIAKGKRKYAYACLDWTEKMPHLAGTLGAAVCNAMMERKWIARHEEKRMITITDHGQKALKEIINLDFYINA
ncbi:MAG TPA: winged helix-turn-helix domain-containing protein [Mucilaginibacter sp.]|nr:winged helix-turn-helix domain-containing protein [Mucilaginibacter sp.]